MQDEIASQRTLPVSRAAILHEVAMAIRHYQDSSEAEADLATAVRLLCEDTRRRALPIERAIIDVKTTLLAEVPDLAPGDSLSAARARCIRMTIEEYYRV